jgi:hypothetical protein
VCGEPDVAIVEADDLQTTVNERLTECVRLMNGLRGDPHNEQHHRHIAIPEAPVGDIDPCGPDLRCLLAYDRSIELVHWL